jgi:hypothetical protein
MIYFFFVRRVYTLSALLFVLFLVVSAVYYASNKRDIQTGAPPYGEPEESAPEKLPGDLFNNWKRPDGPLKVGLQAGHWKTDELPEELKKLHGSTGSSGGGKAEWEVNLAIAERTAEILRAQNVVVEVLPATVPPSYWADAFVAVHADGNIDPSVSGFKVASSWRDYSRKSGNLVQVIEQNYQGKSGLTIDPNISRNMRGYYAFAWWRYEHAIHPMTSAAIFETGFLTSYSDRKLIVEQPELVSEILAEAIMEFLRTK